MEASKLATSMENGKKLDSSRHGLIIIMHVILVILLYGFVTRRPLGAIAGMVGIQRDRMGVLSMSGYNGPARISNRNSADLRSTRYMR